MTPPRFNPPPTWPLPPPGWTPPPGWRPDPRWPSPPNGWRLWIDDDEPGRQRSALTTTAQGLSPWQPERRLDGGSAVSSGSKVYDAFISYSHAVDGRLAPALQRALHRFAKPWYRLRALRVFRDEASLSANPALWASIQKALAGAEFFILLASPQAAQSEWVTREVQYWRQHKGASNFLIALTDGELAWDRSIRDFRWPETSALSASFRGAFTDEPRYVDLRWARTADDVSLRHPRFRECVADLAAPLQGKPKDELVGEDVRQRRRTLSLVRSAVALLLILAVVASTAAVIAVRRSNEARVQRDRALEQARIATSRYLASLAVAKRQDQLDLSLLLSVEALRTSVTVEARDALRGGVASNPRATFLHGTTPVLDVAFSPDGATLVSATVDGAIQLWDVPGRRTLGKPLTGHRGAVTSVAFSHDGHLLASGGGDRTVRLWDVAGRQPLGDPLTANRAVNDVAFSPDGRIVVAGVDDGSVRLWDVHARRTLGKPLTGHRGAVISVAFSPDGHLLASGGEDETVRLWDLPSHRALGKPLTGHDSAVGSLAFSPDGRSLAAAGYFVRLWDLADRRSRELSTNQFALVTSLAFSHDGRTLAAGDAEGKTSLWDVPGETSTTKTLGGHVASSVWGVDFSPGGALASAGQDGEILVWDNPRGGTGPALTGHRGAVNSLAFSGDGRVLASGGDDHTIRLWNPSVLRPLGTPLAGHRDDVTSLSFSRDGGILASADAAGRILLWDVAGRSFVALADLAGSWLSSVAFSPDGTVLASGGDDIRLWDVRTRQQIGAPMRGHVNPVNSLAFSPDGSTLASAGEDGRLLLWDVRRHMLLTQLQESASPLRSVAFSSDGHTLAAGDGNGKISLWEVGVSALRPFLGTLDIGIKTDVASVAFSPDGRTLASADEDVQLWDVADRRRLDSPVNGHKTLVRTLAFSPDGDTLASGDYEGVVIVSSIGNGSLESHACAIANRNLSRDEWQHFIGSLRPYRSTCPGLWTPQ
jgi:WD40 repeat protein